MAAQGGGIWSPERLEFRQHFDCNVGMPANKVDDRSQANRHRICTCEQRRGSITMYNALINNLRMLLTGIQDLREQVLAVIGFCRPGRPPVLDQLTSAAGNEPMRFSNTFVTGLPFRRNEPKAYWQPMGRQP